MTAERHGGEDRGGPGSTVDPAPARAPLDLRLGRLGTLPVGRLAGFLGLPLISAVAPFLVLPVLLHQVGTDAWAGIAIGQAVGTGVSTLVMLGWPVVGPSLVAADPSRRSYLYTQSLVSRLTVFGLTAPLGMVLAGVLAPRTEWVAAVLMALAMSLLGLSGTWFFIGTGRASDIARFDTVPRVVATGVAALLISLVPWAWLYPATLASTSAVLAVVVSARFWEPARWAPLRTTVQVVRQQWAAAGVSLQAALNTMLPMTLLAAVAPGAVAGYAAIERVTKFTVFGLAAVGQAFQGWVSEPCASPAQRRRMAFVVTTGAGIVLAGALLFLADPLLHVLFAAKIEVPDLAVVFASVCVVCVALGTTLGFHYLVPLRMSSWLALSTLVSILVAAGAMLVFAPRYGIVGASLSVMLAEICVVLTQALGLTLAARRRSRRRAHAPEEALS